jgi:hypothetical protein
MAHDLVQLIAAYVGIFSFVRFVIRYVWNLARRRARNQIQAPSTDPNVLIGTVEGSVFIFYTSNPSRGGDPDDAAD